MPDELSVKLLALGSWQNKLQNRKAEQKDKIGQQNRAAELDGRTGR